MGVGQPDADEWVQGLTLGGNKEGQFLQEGALGYEWLDSHSLLTSGVVLTLPANVL